MIILHAAPPELGGAGLASDSHILDSRLAGCASTFVNDLVHALANFFDHFRCHTAIRQEIGAYLCRFLEKNGAVLGDDLVDHPRIVAGSAIGDGGSDHRHLQGSREHVSLANGGIRREAGAPARLRIDGCKPLRSGQHAGSLAREGNPGFLAEAKHVSCGNDLIDSRGVSILVEEGVARDFDRIGKGERAMRAALVCDPASHILVAVLDAAVAGEGTVAHASAQARESDRNLIGRAGSVGADGAVEERVGLVLV